MNPYHIWTIYWDTSDYPREAVARKWDFSQGEPRPLSQLLRGRRGSKEAQIEKLRARIQKESPGAIPVNNHAMNDQPCIVEVWL